MEALETLRNPQSVAQSRKPMEAFLLLDASGGTRKQATW